MKTVFESCQPREEVLDRELHDDMFAARLRDVVERGGTRDGAIYADPALFFANTYPTDGLRALAREVAGRLSGVLPASSPFIRLETSFGGGKTHSLIALHHMARGGSRTTPANVVDPALLAGTPWPVAGIVGPDLDPSAGTPRGSVVVHTLWGELAWQIGGEAAFAHVAEQDAQRVSPGSASLEKILGDGPALVMIDEIALHLRAAKGARTANGQSDLAQQTVAFLMTLLEYAASRPRVSVVLTLAERADAFNQETEQVLAELTEIGRISARRERILRPTSEVEIANIVTHRLFRTIDAGAAEETARAYREALTQAAARGTEIPVRALREEYAPEFVRSYPFHPELLSVLERKIATVPNFQRTRGALRLLASVVRNLWRHCPGDALVIGAHHVDLGDASISDDLTSRLERPRFRPVIEADIASGKASEPAHCEEIDAPALSAGKAPFARRIGTTIFLHSLVHAAVPGIDRAELALSVLQPGDDPELARQSLDQMLGQVADGLHACWYLHADKARLWFKTEPSLEKVIQDEATGIARTAVKHALEQRIRTIWKKDPFVPVYFPANAAEVDDDAANARLVVLHFDALAVSATSEGVPTLLAGLFDHASLAQKFRSYKNHVLFLVVDEGQREAMVNRMRRSLAVDALLKDEERLKNLTEVQVENLKQQKEASPLEVRVAITRAYRHLYYPQSGAESLARVEIPAGEQGLVEDNQTAVVLRVLREHGKVITGDAADMPAPTFVRQRAWPANATSITTADLRREFARRVGLKIVVDETQLKKCIRVGVEKEQWVYYNPAEGVGYGAKSPTPLIALSDDATLYTLEEAARRKIPIKGEAVAPEQACPICSRPLSACVCGDDETPRGPGGGGGGGGGGGPDAPPPPRRHRASIPMRPVAQAFQELVDSLHDHGVKAIAWLSLRVDGGSDAKRLGIAIPQLGGAVARVTQSAAFTVEDGGDRLSLSYEGSWDRFKRVKSLTDAMAQEAPQGEVRTVVTLMWTTGQPVAGEDLSTAREVLGSVGVSALAIEAEEFVGEAGA